jgi:hypothetical protein
LHFGACRRRRRAAATARNRLPFRAPLATACIHPPAPHFARAAAQAAYTVAAVEGRAKLSRRDKELASLAPWAWDPNVAKHKPGRAMMRDFSEARRRGGPPRA